MKADLEGSGEQNPTGRSTDVSEDLCLLQPRTADGHVSEGLKLRKPSLLEFFREETMTNYSIHLIYLTVPGLSRGMWALAP